MAAALLAVACAQGADAQRLLSGSAGLQHRLERLNTAASALMIAAHPDDENTALLAWLALGRNVRTGYLSLTRGEGGQNLIGSEQGALLGVIRTQELLAARRLDGAQQFFTHAVDFGFTKTAEETLRIWDRERVLGDIVYVIRSFRPDVIILRFSGTPRDGHGQHQASAILGKEAFAAAADPSRFPEQLRTVKPWQAKRLVWNAFSFTRDQEKEASAMPNRLPVDLGAFDPLLGYSYSEIAGMSRSQHRSQGMGSPERRGSVPNFLAHVAGEPAKTDLFDGVRMDSGIPELKEAVRTFRPREPETVVPLLLKARAKAANPHEVDEAIADAAGLWLDASADRPAAAAGSNVRVTLQAVMRSRTPAELLAATLSGGAALPIGQQLAFNAPTVKTVQWTAADVAPRDPGVMPEPAPVLTATFAIRIGGEEIRIERPVQHRYVDKVRGELTRPFEVVPPVSLSVADHAVVFPTAAPRVIAVTVRAQDGPRAGTVQLQATAGWKVAPTSQEFRLSRDGEETLLRFEVTPPGGASSADLAAVAETGGTKVTSSVLVIDYPHIPAQTVFGRAIARVVRADIVVRAKSVGYVVGSGDDVPAALRQIGCDVTFLGPEDLARGDLSRFDAIVTGVRAYNTRPDLRANQSRLMQYAENGGAVIVQYNVAEGGFGGGDPKVLDNIGPWPLTVGRERVTVEEAPVELLKSGHPLLTSPNRIVSADWEGWVQERGLYFASKWDPRYETLIAMHDPGEPALTGGIIYGRVGKGTYVFTPLSWFRQLPAGVPGAYRIFANLLSAGRPQ